MSQNDPLTTLLPQGLEQLHLPREPLCSQFATYLALLQKWNQTHNLTAIRDPAGIITHHFLDSLSLQHYIKGTYVIDVGTGAGFPGLPLALICPEKQFILLDSLKKRVNFLTQVVGTLKLNNVHPVHDRIENFQSHSPIDCIVSRAFASLDKFVNNVLHLCQPQTLLVAMKGQYPHDEIDNLPETVELLSVESLQVPFLNESRHVVLLQKKR